MPDDVRFFNTSADLVFTSACASLAFDPESNVETVPASFCRSVSLKMPKIASAASATTTTMTIYSVIVWPDFLVGNHLIVLLMFTFTVFIRFLCDLFSVLVPAGVSAGTEF